jgi:hypothetical protein
MEICDHVFMRVKHNIYSAREGKILEMFVVCEICDKHFTMTNVPETIILIESDKHTKHALSIRSNDVPKNQ